MLNGTFPDGRYTSIWIPVALVLLLGWGLLGIVPAFAQEKLETARDTNDRIQQLASAFQSRKSDYLIGGGDLLHVEVFDVPDLSREVRVSDSGFISLPLIPVRIQALGLTPYQLEQKLAELLQTNGLVTNAQVTVFVKEHRSHPITVIGSVHRPMVVQAVHEMTLLEVLSEAGGIAEDAGDVVIVTRPGEAMSAVTPGTPSAAGNSEKPPADGKPISAAQAITIKINDLLESGDPKYNVLLTGGDIVSVPRAGIVYVVGAVEHSGGFVLQSSGEQMTTLKLIALAQGLKGTAKPGDAVIIRRNPENGTKQEINVDLRKIMSRKAEDLPVRANDILFVPDSSGKRALRRVGEVAISLTTGITIVRASR
jgi:polysaccharide export outer membrane protein